MSQRIINGFTQYFSYTYLSGKFYGTPTTQVNEDFTDVNTQADLIGDSIQIDEEDEGVISAYRDGAFLHVGQGFEIIAPNVVRITPGLLDTETFEIKKLVGASGVVENIPVVPPTPGAGGYNQTINEASVYTDSSATPINAFAPVVVAGKTRITPEFTLNEGKVDVFINGFRVSVNDGVWTFADSDTIELNDNYSATRMKVDIIKQKVG